jgi:manganese/zinc/iron transport system ATP- binding protein
MALFLNFGHQRHSSQNACPLEVHDLSVSYQQKSVLYGVDFAVPAGQIVGIIGPNGAGKSTLLKTIMGLVRPDGGWVKIFGKSFDEMIGTVGYVPQRESVDWDFPVSVEDVVLMGRYGRLGLIGRLRHSDYTAAHAALDRVGMLSFKNRQIGQLSGGQQQRVFLARALAQNSQLYLMDEPFAGVDAATEAAIISLLHELKAQGKTIIVVHHDLSTARQYFDRLVLLNMRLVAYGTVDEVFNMELLQKTYGGRLNILSEVAQRGDLHI